MATAAENAQLEMLRRRGEELRKERNATQAAQRTARRKTGQAKDTQDRGRSVGDPTYSWIDPRVRGMARGTYDAKTLPYDVWGTGLANYNWHAGNIHEKIDLARKRTAAGDKSGGMKQIYESMEKWADKHNPQLKTYLKTGKIPKGVNMDTILKAADYGLRETGRHQQTKQGFFDSGLFKALKTAATVAAAATGNPWLAAGVGGATGAMDGGLKGALTGAAMGYAGGKFAGGFQHGAPTNFMGPLQPNPSFFTRLKAGLGSLPGAGLFTGGGLSPLTAINTGLTGINLLQGMSGGTAIPGQGGYGDYGGGMMSPLAASPQFSQGLASYYNPYNQMSSRSQPTSDFPLTLSENFMTAQETGRRPDYDPQFKKDEERGFTV